MNIVRKLLLNLAGGSPREEYLEIKKENGILNQTLRRIKSSISFGAQCPMCYRTYEIHIDITQPLRDKKQPVRGVHCPHCRHKHPMMWWFSKYEITSVKAVDAKKINE